MASTSAAALKRFDQPLACAICGRTILLGEEPLRFVHEQRSRTVCRLCVNDARGSGWVEDGRPSPPPITPLRSAGLLRRIFRRTTQIADVHLADPASTTRGVARAEDIATATARLIGIDAFNASPYRATVSGIAKSLGQPRVSVVAYGGRRPGIAVTIVWDLCWYRYLVEPGGAPVVRLDARGDSITELAPRWRDWNALTTDNGSIVLDIKPPRRAKDAGTG